MDCIIKLVKISEKFIRTDVIDILILLKKINKIEDNIKMFDMLLYHFSVVTDSQYDDLKNHLFN